MRGVVIALALVACRPPSEAAPPEVTRPEPAPVEASVAPDPPPTVNQALFHVPVVARSLARTAGGVQVKLRYFEVELANERARAGLAAHIDALGELERWRTFTGEGKVGEVDVECTTDSAINVLVSVLCRVRDASDAGASTPPITRVRAGVFAIDGPKVRPLGLIRQLRPEVPLRHVIMVAVDGASTVVRDAWRDGRCSAGEPQFTLTREGMTLWPDALTPDCGPRPVALGALRSDTPVARVLTMDMQGGCVGP